jgi:hypothetical protein
VSSKLSMGAAVACAILSVAKANNRPAFSRSDYKPYVSCSSSLQEEIENKFGVRFSEHRILKSAKILEVVDVTLISKESDDYPSISVDFVYFEKLCKSRKFKNVSTLVKDFFSKFHTIKCFGDFGDEWLEQVIYQFKDNQFDDGIDDETIAGEDIEVPASDRVVRLSDNSQSELEEASDAVINALEVANGIDGDPTIREIILGQLKAGRELIRGQIFNVQMMHLLLMDALKRLVDKYDGHVIGATAATLIELLIKHVFGTN